MTVPALDVLRRVRARWTNDIGWPANDEEHDLYEQSDVALADLDALVQAARDVSETERTGVLPDFQPLADALARVTGEAR